MEYEQIKSELYELTSNEFERKLLDACFYNLSQKDNILRFNNFSYSIRELSRHILHSLSPDTEVLNCSWYRNKISDNPKGITRSQRIKYAIQGGLSDHIMTSQVIDVSYVKKCEKELVSTIEMLNKFTHINNSTFEINQSEIDKKALEVLNAFKTFLNTIKKSREYIINKIEDKLTTELIEKSLWEVSDDIDILATHHNIEEINVENFCIEQIEANKIVITAYGNIDVRLQWGSNGDLKRGDGHEIYTAFPFKSKMTADFKKKIQYSSVKVENFEVNTDSWYE